MYLIAVKCAHDILQDLDDRQGMDMIRELECNDPETYREIQMEIAKHVNRAIEKVLGAES